MSRRKLLIGGAGVAGAAIAGWALSADDKPVRIALYFIAEIRASSRSMPLCHICLITYLLVLIIIKNIIYIDTLAKQLR